MNDADESSYSISFDGSNWCIKHHGKTVQIRDTEEEALEIARQLESIESLKNAVKIARQRGHRFF